MLYKFWLRNFGSHKDLYIFYYDNKNCSHSTTTSNIKFKSIYFNNINTAAVISVKNCNNYCYV